MNPGLRVFTELPRETVWKILSTSQPSYHEPCHRDIDKRFSGGAQPLVVLAHPTVLREPREGTLHNPAAREDLEAPARKQLLPIDLPTLFRPLLRPPHRDLLWRRLGSAMNDLDAQAEHLFHPVLAPALVPGIYPQVRKAWKAISYTLQQQFDPVLIGDLGAVDLGFEHQALRIHQEMTLPAANFLPTVVSTRLTTYTGRLGRL